MSKFARAISQVASVVAIVAPFFGPVGAVVGAVAAGVAATAGTIAQVTQKKPGALGAVNQVVLGSNLPITMLVGRSYAAGVQVYDNSGGPNNIIRFNINVISAAGPIDSFETFLADFAPVPLTSGTFGAATGYYSDFLWVDQRFGTRPDTGAYDDVTPMPEWDSSRKLSGFASYKVAMKFDKDAKRYSGGVPQFGVVAKGVKIYDPRLDGTYPGGVGPQRWNDEATWTWSENPALHMLAYARGRFIEKTTAGAPLVPPVKIIGCGFKQDAIDLAVFVEAANLCEANGWTCGGQVFEAPGTNKWDNLKRYAQAFAAQPVLAGARLTLRLSAPRPSLFTITEADLVEGSCEARAMRPFQDRRNSIVPRFRSEFHRWEHVQGSAVTVSTYLAEDGELRSQEVQYDLVQNKDQAAELAAYELVNGRELGPITLTLKPRLMRMRPGEAATITVAELGLTARKCVMTARSVDPATGVVTAVFESETDAKHDFALGRTGTAPPTPTIRALGEVDQIVGAQQAGALSAIQLIRDSSAADLTFSVADDGKVTLGNHTRVYLDKSVAVTGVTNMVTGAVPGDLVLIYYDDEARAGGAVTYGALVVPAGIGPTEEASTSPDNPYRHPVAARVVPATGQPPASGGTDAGSGGGGSSWQGIDYQN